MRALLKLLPLICMAACSTLVGADFDDLELAPRPVGGSGGSSGDGGSAGGDRGGSSGKGGGSGEGGAPSGGGESSVGGTPAAGNAAGGNAGAGAETSGGQNAGGSSGQGTAGAGGTNDDSGGAGAGGGGTSGAGGSGGEELAVVVLNEIKGEGSGDDFIELYNLGPGQKTLSGYKLADNSNAFVFPEGTLIPEGGYVLLLIGDLLVPGGPFMCFTPYLTCFHDTGWGISQNGEDVFFRDPGNQQLDTTNYPLSVVDGESWGRYPDGTGDFVVTDPTPEADNELP